MRGLKRVSASSTMTTTTSRQLTTITSEQSKKAGGVDIRRLCYRSPTLSAKLGCNRTAITKRVYGSSTSRLQKVRPDRLFNGPGHGNKKDSNHISKSSGNGSIFPDTLPHGMRRIDYSHTAPPPRLWPMPPHPPKEKSIVNYVAPVTAFLFGSMFLWIFLNPDDDHMEFWQAIDAGRIPLPASQFDDDDDDDFDDDDFDDEEDEWEDAGNFNEKK